MQNLSFSIGFYLNDKKGKEAVLPLYCRITVNRKSAEISLKRMVEVSSWDKKRKRLKGGSELALTINHYIGQIEMKIYKIHAQLADEGINYSAKTIKDRFTGKLTERHFVLETFKTHNEQVRELANLDRGFSKGTAQRFETTYKHVSDYIESRGNKDIEFNDVNIEWINSLIYYLKTVKGIGNNTTFKYVKNLKKIHLIAMRNGWVQFDPYQHVKTKLDPVMREFLSAEELQLIEDKRIIIPRVDEVRDVFLFCCYTGLRYSDVKQLKNIHITRNINGHKEIHLQTQKTGRGVHIPLLPLPEQIIYKYQSHPRCIASDQLLPVLSNQKMNAYLKEIAGITGIQKNITFHMARHTFATTVTLERGISMETVKAVLGHTDIRTTQIYGQITNKKVHQEMMGIRNKLA